MNSHSLDVLKKVAMKNFKNYHAGLYTLLKTEKYLAKMIERSYRLKAFENEHEFYMTANERIFHLIGFMDAIIYFSRSGLFDENDNESKNDFNEDDLDENEKEINKKEREEYQAIMNFICCFETGEEW